MLIKTILVHLTKPFFNSQTVTFFHLEAGTLLFLSRCLQAGQRVYDTIVLYFFNGNPCI